MSAARELETHVAPSALVTGSGQTSIISYSPADAGTYSPKSGAHGSLVSAEETFFDARDFVLSKTFPLDKADVDAFSDAGRSPS